MAWFSNSTEWEAFESNECADCLHYDDGGCPVALAHIAHGYDQNPNDDSDPLASVLSTLVPNDGKCAMRITNKPRQRLPMKGDDLFAKGDAA